jgi:gas vesicle protein
MNPDTQERRSYCFAIGMLTGAFVGAGVALWLVPRATSELGERMAESARSLGKQASDRYQQAGIRVAETVDRLARQAQDARDEVASAVGRGAREVDRVATAAVSHRSADTSARSHM